MRVVRPSLNIFLDMLKDLEQAEQELRECAEDWSKWQEYRDNGYGIDQDEVAYSRRQLEEAIINHRKLLAAIYDFGGDKGLY